MLTWKCHICSRHRPDSKISVHQTDVSEKYNLPKGTTKQNVRYCNDNPDCVEKATTFTFFNKGRSNGMVIPK